MSFQSIPLSPGTVLIHGMAKDSNASGLASRSVPISLTLMFHTPSICWGNQISGGLFWSSITEFCHGAMVPPAQVGLESTSMANR